MIDLKTFLVWSEDQKIIVEADPTQQGAMILFNLIGEQIVKHTLSVTHIWSGPASIIEKRKLLVSRLPVKEWSS